MPNPEDEINFPEGYPEEAKQQIRTEVARRSMEMQSQHLMMKGFFNETLDQDGAVILKGILGAIGSQPALAGYWEGYMARLIEDRFDLCPGCGKNHDTDLSAALAEHGIAPVIFGNPAPHVGAPSGETPDDMSLIEDPNQPGFSMTGDRLASCGTCNGDRTVPVCEHAAGVHGQGGGGGRECPEPTLAPCPECRTPAWYEKDSLAECPRTICTEGELIPLEEPGILICATCGVRWNIVQINFPES